MSIITTLVNYLLTLISKLGYVGIFTVIGLEYACFPIPSEVVLPFVGMSIPLSDLEFLPSYLISILAGIAGSLVCYYIGLLGGNTLLNRLFSRSDAFQTAYAKFSTWFGKYGRLAVLFSRVIPLTRTYISFFAGAGNMSLFDFILYSMVGVAAWNLLLMSLGFYVGNNWTLITNLLNTYSHIVLTLLAIGIAIFIIKKWIFHPSREAKKR